VLGDYFRSVKKGTKHNNPGGKKGTQIDTSVDLGKSSKMQELSDLGFTQKEVERIQSLTAEAVEKAKADARENNDIPTRSLAIHIAKQEKK